jgi:hypothetical protein
MSWLTISVGWVNSCLFRQHGKSWFRIPSGPASIFLSRHRHPTFFNEALFSSEDPHQLTISNMSLFKSKSKLCYDWWSAGQSWCQAPIWGPRSHFCCCQTPAGLLMWDALSDERKGLSFTIAPSPRQRILGSDSFGPHDHILLSQIRDSPTWGARSLYLHLPGTGWPSYTPGHRVPFSSPSATRKATVEVFQPPSTRRWSKSRWDQSIPQFSSCLTGNTPWVIDNDQPVKAV